MTKDEELILETYKIARSAVANGNHPFGALIWLNGEVILTAENTVSTDSDCTCHAELNLVRKAYKELDQDKCSSSTLYTSTEPCAMCAGAIYWCGIRKVVYGCSATELGKVAGKTLEISSKDIYADAQEEVEVVGPILEEQGVKIHQDFWPQHGT